MEINDSIREYIREATWRFGIENQYKVFLRPATQGELEKDVYMLCILDGVYLNATILVGDVPEGEVRSSCYHEAAHMAFCEMTELAQKIRDEKRKSVRRELWEQYRNAVERACQRFARAAEREIEQVEHDE